MKDSSGIIAGEATVEPNQEQRGVQLEIRSEGVEGIAVLPIRRDPAQGQSSPWWHVRQLVRKQGVEESS